MESLEPSTTPAAGASEAKPPASAAAMSGDSSGPSSDDSDGAPWGERRTAVSSTESSRYSWVVSFAGAVLLDMASLRAEGERVELLGAPGRTGALWRAWERGAGPAGDFSKLCAGAFAGAAGDAPTVIETLAGAASLLSGAGALSFFAPAADAVCLDWGAREVIGGRS